MAHQCVVAQAPRELESLSGQRVFNQVNKQMGRKTERGQAHDAERTQSRPQSHWGTHK